MSEHDARDPARRGEVRLEHVDATDDGGRRGRARGALRSLSLVLPRGCTAVLGTPEDGTLALSLVLAGLTRPSAGRALVGGDPLARSARRGEVAALTADPLLPELREVTALARLVARARGEPPERGDELLGRFGLEALARRSVQGLSHEEARALEAALALSHPAPSLVVAFEPGVELGPLEPELVRRALHEHAQRAPVVVLTSSHLEASSYAGAPLRLVRGALVAPSAPSASSHGAPTAERLGVLDVWLREAPYSNEQPTREREASQARALATALVDEALVTGTMWEVVRTSTPTTPGLSRVRVRSRDVRAAAKAVARAAHEGALDVLSLGAAPGAGPEESASGERGAP